MAKEAKAVVKSLDGGGWSRTVELDGHGSVHHDDVFDWDVPAPESFGMCIRYALAFRSATRAPTAP